MSRKEGTMDRHNGLVATARERRVPLKDEDGRVQRNEDGKTIYSERVEIVRRGECPDHGKQTESFHGVNSHGWVFRCPGLSDEDVRETTHRPTEPHYFVNDAAPEVKPCKPL